MIDYEIAYVACGILPCIYADLVLGGQADVGRCFAREPAAAYALMISLCSVSISRCVGVLDGF